MGARMLVLLVVCSATLASATTTTRQVTVWKAQAKADDGSYKPIVFIGETPDDLLPPCRCVAGTWKIAAKNGETATHFIGTLDALSFNHARAAKKRLSIKIRKTRDLMGVHRDYRPALLAIVRGSGQLVLREVKGGDWEVVGYAPSSVGKLFANNPRWKADPKASPKPAAATPVVDPKADAAALAKLINDYRATLELPRVPLSVALTKVAQAHVRDLAQNAPVKDGCNLHSWSAKGAWSACCYDSSKEAARCMWVKPKEIAGYRGNGYEIAATASGITPEQALELWQKSPKHHEVMINKGIWTKPWAAMGVAVEGDYSVAWFADR
ncbi:MAG: hypothetical protein HOV81_12035 [Kofleriaceae bacterium]|nr:hypothetical protein [Kofleriaceae bacterium]